MPAAYGSLHAEGLDTKPIATDDLIGLRERFASTVSYVDHTDYHNPTKYEEILRGPTFDNSSVPANHTKKGKDAVGRDASLPNDELWTWLPQTPLLTPVQELGLFLRYNFLKCKQSSLQREFAELAPTQVSESTLREFGHLEQLALADRNHILEANSRLIVSVAKKFISPTMLLDELIAEGVFTILRAIDHFECGRGFKFSTYATLALQRHFIRFSGQEQTRATRFQPSELIEGDSVPHSAAPIEAEQRAEILQSLIHGMVQEHLDLREQQIVLRRFGLDRNKEDTLKVVGERLGVTKERVRQLERRALDKLRVLIDLESELEDLTSDELSGIRLSKQLREVEQDFTELCAKIVLALPRKGGEGVTLSQLVDWADSLPNKDRCVELLWKALDNLITLGAIIRESSQDGAAYYLSESAKEHIDLLRPGITNQNLQSTITYLETCSASQANGKPT
jgi:RNA polymerase primary sigma factor